MLCPTLDMAKRSKSPQRKEEEPAPDVNKIKALPPPENYSTSP